ncbi:glycosyltransferase family 2 protein [Allocoleopsis sp.]|uniref:glycosyltransferase family 2 protein n=1 Tax=Allocoleopsis sp. TaxID=3088169 RepID=UPI002FD1A8DD
MADWQLQTPVALFIFKRPETTEKVFEAIRQAKPPIFLVIAEGPGAGKVGEAEKCAATRAIIDRVDWDCQVLKNYAEIDIGCSLRVSTGLKWVFDIVEEAIFLEDDCVPHPTFFRFCEELLNYYRYDQRIGSISGQNVQFGHNRTEYTYYFSRYFHCWGWASWRRAWQHYDLEMKLWPEVRDKNLLQYILEDPKAVKDWTRTFQMVYEKKLDSWGFPWMLNCWSQNFLTILPNVNLISNIGHGVGATHTTDKDSKYSNMPVEAVTFPLKHPPFIVRHRQADDFTEKTLFDYKPGLIKRMRKKIQKIGKI